jgi:hypothetical protein
LPYALVPSPFSLLKSCPGNSQAGFLRLGLYLYSERGKTNPKDKNRTFFEKMYQKNALGAQILGIHLRQALKLKNENSCYFRKYDGLIGSVLKDVFES